MLHLTEIRSGGKMVEALKERGWFWWAGKKFDKNELAPSDHEAGTLTIEQDGRVQIELDGELPKAVNLSQLRDSSSAPSPSIAGLLKGGNQHILACNVHRSNHRWSSNGISFDTFSAQTCLVSSKRLPITPRARALKVSLEGYGEWLRFHPPVHKMTSRSVTLRHKVSPDLRYQQPNGTISLSRDVNIQVKGMFGSSGTEIRESVIFRFAPRQSMDLLKAVEKYIAIQDFFILLTGSEYQLEWPSLTLTTNQTCTLYFQLTPGEAAPPDAYECITSFPEIEVHFGSVFFAWLQKREELGPGVYLYLATRRSGRLYEEHRLTSLVSGLETFHRSLFHDARSMSDEDRLQRIFDDIQERKDREWLRRRTRNFGTPSLEQRLREILSTVAFGIEPKELNKFCALTAGIRNELFHHGRSKRADLSGNSLQFLSEISHALAYMYHARIMTEIGVPKNIVERWFTNSRDSYRINWYMERVGLRKSAEENTGL